MPIVHMRRRLLAENTVQNALAVTSGMHTVATVGDLIAANETIVGQMMVTLGEGKQTSEKRRGIEITAFGTGTDNATMTFAVFQMKRGQVANSRDRLELAPDFELTLLYTVVCTLSTAVGAEDATLITSSERIADTMVVTQSAAAAAIETAYGSAPGATYTATANTPTRFFLPDVGGGDVLIEVVVGTATSANVLIESQT